MKASFFALQNLVNLLRPLLFLTNNRVNYEPSFGYELVVDITQIENPPADGSPLRYTLVEQVAKIDVSEEEGSEMPSETIKPLGELDGTEWVLSGIQQEGEMTTAEIDKTITASFAGGRIAGVAGCNNFGADYTINGDSIELGVAAATMMACPDEIWNGSRLSCLHWNRSLLSQSLVVC